MKKQIISTVATLSAIVLLTGCIDLSFGGKKSDPSPAPAANATPKPTLGQQLVDLQKAKDSGAINDPEFQIQKAKLLKESR